MEDVRKRLLVACVLALALGALTLTGSVVWPTGPAGPAQVPHAGGTGPVGVHGPRANTDRRVIEPEAPWVPAAVAADVDEQADGCGPSTPPGLPVPPRITPRQFGPPPDEEHHHCHVIRLDNPLQWLREHTDDAGCVLPAGFLTAGERHGRVGSYRGASGQVGSEGIGDDSLSDAATALALLGFLMSGYTHTEGEFADSVKRMLRYC